MSALCCGGAACCGACCAGFKACGVPAKNFPKVSYVISSMLMMVISVVLMFTLRYATEEWDWYNCAEVAGGGSVCFGMSSAFRMSFTLFLYHLIILLFIFPRAQCSMALHDGFWGVKFLILIGLSFVVYFIPYEFYTTWGWICLVVSAFFLFI